MDYKEENKKTYNLYAEKFNESFGKYFETFAKEKASIFLEQLPGKKILDLGAGPGNHALYFKQHGCEVLCADIAEEMLALCKKKGLQVTQMDIENITFPEKSFDGIWAYTSLLHVPKSKLKEVIKKLRFILREDGLLHVSVIEGNGERFETRHHYPNTQRFFTYFSEDEIAQLFQNDFKILSQSKTASDKNALVFLDFLFKKAN